MKFRGKIINYVSIRNFAQLLQTISKVAKQSVFRITTTQIIFILTEKEIKANGITCWCEFATDKLFSEYVMEGHSALENEIYLEISLEYLASALSSLRTSHNAIGLKLKLTKKCVPCLTIEIETQMTNSVSVCIHDIPIAVILPRDWGEYQQPHTPIFSISLALPEVKMVRQTMERLKNVSPCLTITAKPQTLGTIILSVESLSVTSEVTYPGLRIYQIDGQDPGTVDLQNGTEDEDRMAEPRSFKVQVEMKNLFHILPSDSLKATSSICSIVEGRLVHLFYICGDATLQYSIPAISLNE